DGLHRAGEALVRGRFDLEPYTLLLGLLHGSAPLRVTRLSQDTDQPELANSYAATGRARARQGSSEADPGAFNR
ncbi:MAG TPA: hypothetical protein VGU21_09150, partial [Streptosporangiaceae bacterium]|nr:hypothetical protein [Streptosporangiaceae bacterium]